MRAGGFAAALMPRYGSSIRSRDGSSMTPRKSTARSSRSRKKRSPPRRCRHPRSRESVSPISARHSWCGSGAADARSIARSSGNAAAVPSICDALRDREDEVAHRTGLLVDPYFSGTKLKWLLDEKPELRERGAARRAVLRHDRHLAGVQVVARRGIRDRLHQRVAHDDVQPGAPRMGRRDARDARRSARDAAARSRVREARWPRRRRARSRRTRFQSRR